MQPDTSSPLQPTITLRHRNNNNGKNNENGFKNVPRQSMLKRISMAPVNKIEHHSLDDILTRLQKFGLSLVPFADALQDGLEITKLSDSTFAEIFQCGQGEKIVMKVMPLGQSSSNDIPIPSSLESVLHEYKAFLALQSLSKQSRYNVPSMHTGFATLESFKVVQGKYPLPLTDAWKSHPYNNTLNPGTNSIIDLREHL